MSKRIEGGGDLSPIRQNSIRFGKEFQAVDSTIKTIATHLIPQGDLQTFEVKSNGDFTIKLSQESKHKMDLGPGTGNADITFKKVIKGTLNKETHEVTFKEGAKIKLLDQRIPLVGSPEVNLTKIQADENHSIRITGKGYGMERTTEPMDAISLMDAFIDER